jgi:membrane-associated protein
MQIIDFFLHLDKHLANIVNQFGIATYGILFAVIFAETGLVVTPFLPGDSLLFAVGALSATGILNIWTVYFSLIIAAILGDTVNYWIGHHMGPRVFREKNSRFLKREYLDKTEKFYEKHGGKTIILARFLPIIRTFAPFVAGVGKMHYGRFFLYNVVGGVVWVTVFVWAGFLFGGIKIVRENFELVVFGIIGFSVLPILLEYVKHKKEARSMKKENHATYKDLEKTFKKEKLSD